MSARPEDYVELRVCSAFSFLEGAANPEDLAQCAALQGHAALALADRDGVYGIPRFDRAARSHGLRPLLGARLQLRDGFPLLLLVESQHGWQNLCQLLSLGHANPIQGNARVGWDQIEEHAAGL